MSITNKLNQIKNALYGKEVRGAIHDAIKQVYDDASVNHDNANMEVKIARGTHNTLNDRLDNVDEIQARTNAQLSQNKNELQNDINGLKQHITGGNMQQEHSHSNKDTIDKFTEYNDELIFNGDSVSVGKFENSGNIFNDAQRNSCVAGYIDPNSGEVMRAENSSVVSQFLECLPDTTYYKNPYASNFHVDSGIGFYNSGKTLIEYVLLEKGNPTCSFRTPSGCNYIRFDMLNEERYNECISTKGVYSKESFLKNKTQVTQDNFVDNSLELQRVSKEARPVVNLFKDNWDLEGYYWLREENGTTTSGSQLKGDRVTKYIKVNELTNYCVSSSYTLNDDIKDKGLLVCFYNSSRAFIGSSWVKAWEGCSPVATFTTPTSCQYIRTVAYEKYIPYEFLVEEALYDGFSKNAQDLDNKFVINGLLVKNEAIPFIDKVKEKVDSLKEQEVSDNEVKSYSLESIDLTPNYDVEGNYFNCHGLGILKHNNKYYAYGESKTGVTQKPGSSAFIPTTGVNCYSSDDLVQWKFENKVLKPNITDSASPIHTSKVIERPKVIYNEATQKFVMIFHSDTSDYKFAQIGIAISDTPTGDFEFLKVVRPVLSDSTCRDLNVFVDDDKKAYVFVSRNENKDMYCHLLTDDYTDFTETYSVVIPNSQYREAPAPFKYNGYYYLLTSGQTGWNPNPSKIYKSETIMGTYTDEGLTCLNDTSNTSYGSQPTNVLKVDRDVYGFDYIAMFDKWNPQDLEKSSYLWLPLFLQESKFYVDNVNNKYFRKYVRKIDFKIFKQGSVFDGKTVTESLEYLYNLINS